MAHVCHQEWGGYDGKSKMDMSMPAQKKLVPSVCRGHSRLLAMPVLLNGLPTHCVFAYRSMRLTAALEQPRLW